MKTIALLIDDPAVGGVGRTLDNQIEQLAAEFRIRRMLVDTRHPLPPMLDDDAVIVHFSSSWAKLPFLTLARAQRSGRPIVLVEHMYSESFERVRVPNIMRFRAMLRLAYRLVDTVVCVSEGQARWMQAAGLVPAAKIRVIRSASDCQHLFEIAPPQYAGDRPLRLAAYGRYSLQKGYDVLIEAMRLVPPAVATLTFAGYGEDEAAMKLAAASLPHVRVGQSVGDLAAFLAQCDAVVVPSRWEPFGLVAAEARSAARPLIVSDLDGLSEQVKRDTGLAVAPENPRLLADAIIRLRGRDLGAMGLAARASVVDHFQEHLRGYRELYASLPARDVVGEPALSPVM